MQGIAGEVDQPIYALITDLKQGGMLDETLIVWSGEFGRTPDGPRPRPRPPHQGLFALDGRRRDQRRHQPRATDELGYNAVEDRVHVNDFHATMLYLFGIDHTRLTYRHQGRDFRLTDFAGTVVRPILA